MENRIEVNDLQVGYEGVFLGNTYHAAAFSGTNIPKAVHGLKYKIVSVDKTETLFPYGVQIEEDGDYKGNDSGVNEAFWFSTNALIEGGM
jgi:hypothetical protein